MKRNDPPKVAGWANKCSGNDYPACIGGHLVAPLVIEHGMRTTVCGELSGLALTTHNKLVVGPDHRRVPHADHEDAGKKRDSAHRRFAARC